MLILHLIASSVAAVLRLSVFVRAPSSPDEVRL